uniref:Uncharacterized protein n=1 Tax=Megaviridae environmental sample TaxID=1737588 RepID=A0A5J6VJP3_9VIRU|nr:MAG: hypothetical protein [Megaviridae environmental sample]
MEKTRESMLLKNLLEFYRSPQGENNIHYMLDIINESSRVSLRMLDWFVTNYSKENTKRIMGDTQFSNFNVHNEYKSCLKAFNKKLFDPFCRSNKKKKIDKFLFYYSKIKPEESIQTTIGQLNFFKWAIENNIIEYVERHFDEIKYDIKTKEKKRKKFGSSTTYSHSSTDETLNYSSREFTPKDFVISFR